MAKLVIPIQYLDSFTILWETIGEMDEYYLHLSREDYTNLFPQIEGIDLRYNSPTR